MKDYPNHGPTSPVLCATASRSEKRRLQAKLGMQIAISAICAHILSAFTLIQPVLAQSNADCGKRPVWIAAPTIDPAYYIGIGQGTSDSAARETAKRQLASEISVTIEGDFRQRTSERGEEFSQDALELVRSRTRAELDAFELVDAWRCGSQHWAYYRLSKVDYAKRQSEKHNNAISRCLDFFLRAQRRQTEGAIAAALGLYIQALHAAQKYPEAPLKVEHEGRTLLLANELATRIPDLLGRIRLAAHPGPYTGKINGPIDKPLRVAASYLDGSGSNVPVADLPLRFRFAHGDGALLETTQTDAQGRTSSQVRKIRSREKTQIVRTTLDTAQLAIGNGLQLPSAQFVLSVSGPTVHIQTAAALAGQTIDSPYVEDAITISLPQHGFAQTGDIANSDYLIELKMSARNGNSLTGGQLYSAFVDLDIAVLDLAKGVEVYRQSISRIKGISRSFARARDKAFAQVGTKLSDDVMPELLSRLAQ
jgi:hypothetical protein